MYFLPEDEVKKSTVSSRLEDNVKLMRVIYLPKNSRENEVLGQFGDELILFSINWTTMKISCCTIDHNGIVRQYDGAQLPDLIPIGYRVKSVETLPLIFICYRSN